MIRSNASDALNRQFRAFAKLFRLHQDHDYATLKDQGVYRNTVKRNGLRLFCALLAIASLGFVAAVPTAAQFYSSFEAKRFLRDMGASYGDFIENAETIIVENGEIEGHGGISVDLPILAFVSEQDVILLDGASGYVTNSGRIFIEADTLHISAVVLPIRGRDYLIVGESLADIANWLRQQF